MTRYCASVVVWLLRRSSPTVEWLRRASLLLAVRIQRWSWKSVVVLVIALIGAALALDVDAALTNALTEAASVLAGVAITVFILDRRQRTREREREGELRRAALTRELSWNLTKMMRRRDDVPIPAHWSISLVMKDIVLSSDDLAKPVYISKEQAAQLGLGFVGNIRFDEVKTDAMKSILDSDLAPDTMADGHVGEAIGRLIEDVEHLSKVGAGRRDRGLADRTCESRCAYCGWWALGHRVPVPQYDGEHLQRARGDSAVATWDQVLCAGTRAPDPA